MQMLASRRLDFFFLQRGLASSVGSQAPKGGMGMGAGSSVTVREPVISLSKEEVLRRPEDSELPSSSPHRPLSYYLDTHTVVLQLQDNGYSLQQAEGLVKLLTCTLERAVTPLERSVLSQRDLDLMEVKMLKELEAVCGKLMLLEKTSLESLRSENTALKEKVEKLMSGFKDEVAKVQSNLQLDLNLEKGRIKEEATGLLQQVNDTNNRIDKEVAQIRTQIEAQKLESVKYLAGVSLSIVTIVLSVVMGVWRLMK